MLSIIISSYQKNYYDQLVENIAKTIGDNICYELIQIWNPNLVSICAAYNMGAAKSKYENLLFLHEDLIFHTQNWGEKLLSHLHHINTGIIGIAGSSYVPKAPSSWTVSEKYNFANIIQSSKKDSNSTHINSTKGNKNKVFAVDGVFLAIKKNIFNHCKFDEILLSGFHGYDLDLSLCIAKTHQNYVVDDILIEHFSKGNQDCNWQKANILVKEKHKYKFQKIINSETEKMVFSGFLFRYFSCFPINFKNVFFTLKFYPIHMHKFADHIFIIKKYFNFIKYSKSLNEKLKSLK